METCSVWRFGKQLDFLIPIKLIKLPFRYLLSLFLKIFQ